MKFKTFSLFAFFSSIIFLVSCSNKKDKLADEQLIASQSELTEPETDSLQNSVSGNITMKQISTYPSEVILTGLQQHRLVSIYKTKKKINSGERLVSKFSLYDEELGNESYSHYMPGIDILFGYNLLNIAHYGMATEKGNFFFGRPVFIKTLYYPSFEQDSLDKKPITRNYYLVSVYDEDTNKDTLLNKKDLRRFYQFDSTGSTKIQIVPKDYSVLKSQYDPKNDAMYIFARHDENNNGTQDESEPIHIFWFSLKSPQKAKRLY